MKLLVCVFCSDVIKLNNVELRTCACGECGGYYKEDGLNAVYWGDSAIPIGFDNSSLVEAIQNQPDSGMGERFVAFVIPKDCPTMVKES